MNKEVKVSKLVVIICVIFFYCQFVVVCIIRLFGNQILDPWVVYHFEKFCIVLSKAVVNETSGIKRAFLSKSDAKGEEGQHRIKTEGVNIHVSSH